MEVLAPFIFKIKTMPYISPNEDNRLPWHLKLMALLLLWIVAQEIFNHLN